MKVREMDKLTVHFIVWELVTVSNFFFYSFLTGGWRDYFLISGGFAAGLAYAFFKCKKYYGDKV